jgi:hypothetical protein
MKLKIRYNLKAKEFKIIQLMEMNTQEVEEGPTIKQSTSAMELSTLSLHRRHFSIVFNTSFMVS